MYGSRVHFVMFEFWQLNTKINKLSFTFRRWNSLWSISIKFHFMIRISRSSGQTWLQLQQQKLRAKKELQHRGDNDYYERNMHTDNRGRPFR